MSANPYESPETGGNSLQRKSNLLRIALWLLAAGAVLAVLVALVLPAVRYSPEAARRMQCGNHLKQIALALQNYADVYGGLPPAYTVDAAGKPLHSWRTLILPFLEQKALYDQIDLSKPWDDPANRAAMEAKRSVYRCPSGNLPNGQTTYLAVVAPGGCFKPTEPRELTEITDGTSQTLMVIEVPDEHAVPWMSPHDADEKLATSFLGQAAKPPHPNGAMAVFVDGHTQFLQRTLDPTILRALISIAGNEKIDDF